MNKSKNLQKSSITILPYFTESKTNDPCQHLLNSDLNYELQIYYTFYQKMDEV